MAKAIKKGGVDTGSLGRFTDRCFGALDTLYRGVYTPECEPRLVCAEAVKYIMRMLAVLVAAEHIPSDRLAEQPIRAAAEAVMTAAKSVGEDFCEVYDEALVAVYGSSGLGIFAQGELPDISEMLFCEVARALLLPDSAIEHIYFQTVPLSWLGSAYQYMLAFKPSEDGEALVASRSYRKGRGVFFTPPALVSYIIEGVLTPLIDPLIGTLDSQSPNEQLAMLKVLDPSMGGGDFLSCAVDYICDSAIFGKDGSIESIHARVAAGCVYGVDVDPVVVEVSRFCVWAASMYADGIADAINSHLVCGNSIDEESSLDWGRAFPEVFDGKHGFDAVVGNPPYIASKNGLSQGAKVIGQSDSYLMFLSTVFDNKLVKPGGMFSMVLPDPILVRENAVSVRRVLDNDWTIVSLLHIIGAFSDALVANVVPICRNVVPSKSYKFQASRIERVADRRNFMLRPRKTAVELAHSVRKEIVTAQQRCEFLYLLESGKFGSIIRRIHGENASLTNYEPPFAPLRSLNVKAIYRGEEVGKAAIDKETGDMPMLLGGQSIRPYEIVWEGRRINRSRIKKPLERYLSTKIIIQKSAAYIIAALDVVSDNHQGYVFPQSVYAVELQDSGMDVHYLLCILNSRVMNEYIWRTVTGYKLLQPQLELEDIRALPIRRVEFTTPIEEREADLARGIGIFEAESNRYSDDVPFPELANFVVQCLGAAPERSDVVHDLLAHLGRLVVKLSVLNRESPDSDITRRLESARAAIETVVWQLYASDSAQMALTL